MKVLKGIYKGVEIVSPDDMAVRPTVDHFKKHILRVAEERRPSRVWDLFAGSGGVGIELLSLGARNVVFVEQLNKALSCLKLNLSQCQIRKPDEFKKSEVLVVQAQVEAFLKTPAAFGISASPDLVFLDPPYGQGLMKKVTPLLLQCPLCTPETLFVAEHVSEDPLAPLDELHGELVSQELYGPKTLSCFRKKI